MPSFEVNISLNVPTRMTNNSAMTRKCPDQRANDPANFPVNSSKTIFEVPISWRACLPGCFRVLQRIYPRGGGQRIGLYEFLNDSYNRRCERVFAWKDGSGYMRAMTRPRHLLPPGPLPTENNDPLNCGDSASIGTKGNSRFLRKFDRRTVFPAVCCKETLKCGTQIYDYRNNLNLETQTTKLVTKRESVLVSNMAIPVPVADDRDSRANMGDTATGSYGHTIKSVSIASGKCTQPKDNSNWVESSLDQLRSISLPNISPSLLTTDGDEAELVGEGAFGRVILKTLHANPTCQVVVKTFIAERVTGLSVLHEARVLSYLNSTGAIPKFFGITPTPKAPGLAIVQEYFGQGITLSDFISDSPALPKDDWMDIALQLANGLRAIHQEGVLNNDIKEDNILIDYRRGMYYVKYIDFGFATFREGCIHQIRAEDVERYAHLAPEVIKGHLTSMSSDVYSFGSVIETIMAAGFICELWDIVSACIHDDADKRPDIGSVVTMLTDVRKRLQHDADMDTNYIYPT